MIALGTFDMPGKLESHSWAEIEAHYISLISNGWQHEPLLALVRHIKKTGLSMRLFAFTSLDDLLIGNYKPMEWHRDTLRIHFDRTKKEWLFEYYSQPHIKPQFTRTYAADKGVTKFDDFLKMINW